MYYCWCVTMCVTPPSCIATCVTPPPCITMCATPPPCTTMCVTAPTVFLAHLPPQAVVWFYLSWRDPRAHNIINENEARMLAPESNFTCQRPCQSSGKPIAGGCCDGAIRRQRCVACGVCYVSCDCVLDLLPSPLLTGGGTNTLWHT
jgi:hypothetical protein